MKKYEFILTLLPPTGLSKQSQLTSRLLACENLSAILKEIQNKNNNVYLLRS